MNPSSNKFRRKSPFAIINLNLTKYPLIVSICSYLSAIFVQEASTVQHSKLSYQPCATVRTSVLQDLRLPQRNAPKGIIVLLAHGRYVDSLRSKISWCFLFSPPFYLCVDWFSSHASSPLLLTFIRSSRVLLARTRISTGRPIVKVVLLVSTVCTPQLRPYLAFSVPIVRLIRRLVRSLSAPRGLSVPREI